MNNKWTPKDVKELQCWYDMNSAYWCGKWIVPNKANEQWRRNKVRNLIKWKVKFWIYSKLYLHLPNLNPPWEEPNTVEFDK